MGANESIPVTVGNPISLNGSCWKELKHVQYNAGKLTNRESRATLYTIDSDRETLAHNAIRVLKRVRHPNILYILRTSNSPAATVAMEYAQPLLECIHQMPFHQLLTGIGSIASAIHFLHSNANVLHNNIGIQALFVRSNGSFALSGFEFATDADQPISTAKSPLQVSYFDRAAKVKNGEVRDVLLFIFTILDVCERHNGDDSESKKVLKEYCQDALSLEEEKIPTIGDVMKHPSLQCDLATIQQNLSRIPLLSPTDKEEFFSTLPSLLEAMESSVIGRFLVQPLLSRCVMLEPLAHKTLYPRLFRPKDDEKNALLGFISTPHFTQFLIPEILYIWKVRDIDIRCSLIKYLPQYIRLISVPQLEAIVIPELHIATSDCNAELVSSSFNALSLCVTVAGVEAVIGNKPTKLFTGGVTKVVVPENGMIGETMTFVTPIERSNHLSNDQSSDWEGEWGDDTSHSELPPIDNEESSLDTAEASCQLSIESIPISNFTSSREISSSKKEVLPEEMLEVKKIVVKTEEDDLFADLAPIIRTKGTVIDQLMKQREENSKKGDLENERDNKVIEETKISKDLFTHMEDSSTIHEGGAWEADLSLDAYEGIEED